MLTFGSLFSGIGGFDLGFEQAGMKCAWQCEIDKQARSVLSTHWPNITIIEDVRNVRTGAVEYVDLICGGFPCQDVSVAGKREGLAGKRSGLWFEFLRVLDELRPQWVVIENVPGLLSSNKGRDFATILQGLVKLRYGVSWRVLDAQYFGVAQRRRRVFIVGSLGDGRSAQVLFEREGLFGHSPKVNKQRQGITPSVASGINGSGLRGRQPGSAASLVSTPLVFDWQSGGDVRHSFSEKPMLQANQTPAIFQQNQRNEVRNLGGLAGSIQAQPGMKQQNYVFFGGNNRSAAIGRSTALSTKQRYDFSSETFILGDGQPELYSSHGRPRRLTPTECERLQGFPDGWTDTDGQSDSARYRQLGNAVAVPVAQWIASRILALT